MKPYTLKHNARRAAKARLGCAATEGEHFTLVAMDGGWIWVDGACPSDEQIAADVKAAQEAAQEAASAPDGSMPPGVAAAGLSEALGGPLAHEGPAADQAKAETPRRPTKGEMVRRMLNRENGATNAEIQAATGWQPHTVRGFFAGNQMKGAGIRAERFEREPGVFAYRARAIRPAEAEG